MIYDGGMTWGGETPQGTGSIDCRSVGGGPVP